MIAISSPSFVKEELSREQQKQRPAHTRNGGLGALGLVSGGRGGELDTERSIPLHPIATRPHNHRDLPQQSEPLGLLTPRAPFARRSSCTQGRAHTPGPGQLPEAQPVLPGARPC